MADGGHPILLFDGTCVMCTGLVPWIVDHESDDDLRFGALQSGAAKRELAAHGLETFDRETMYVIEGDSVFTRSTAVARFALHLRWPWRAVTYLTWIPRPIRDAVYCWVARHRYRWFGTREMCEVPSLSVRGRILG